MIAKTIAETYDAVFTEYRYLVLQFLDFLKAFPWGLESDTS